MALKQGEAKSMQELWEKSAKSTQSSLACDLPEGLYEFVIVQAAYKVSNSGNSYIEQTLEVTGGNEEFVGEKARIVDNLNTEQNMGFFRQKLARLGIERPESFADFESGCVAKSLVGKKFSGRVVHKGEFTNIYVNRFIEDVDVATQGKEEEVEEAAPEELTGKHVSFETAQGAEVMGEVLGEVDGLVRVKTDEGKIFRVKREKVLVLDDKEDAEAEEVGEEAEVEAEVEAEAEEPEKAEPKPSPEDKEHEEEESAGFPLPEEVSSLKMPQIAAVLESYGFNAKKIKNPRVFVEGVSNVIYTKKYMPDLPHLQAMRDGLGMKADKAKPSDVLKKIVSALKEVLDF